MTKWQQFWTALSRRKTYNDDPDEDELTPNQSNSTLTTLASSTHQANTSDQTRNQSTNYLHALGDEDSHAYPGGYLAKLQQPYSCGHSSNQPQPRGNLSNLQTQTGGETLQYETPPCSSDGTSSPTHSSGDFPNLQAQSSGDSLNLQLDSGGEKPKLARVFGLMDLTMLGVGSTLGVGVYVLAGSVARNQAGPSVVLSFVIAAIASLFSGFCYSEFASRISQAGSAYNYTYLSIGEFAAYIVGWNMVLEYIIGTASEAKAISNQIDSLLGNVYENTMTRLLPMRSSLLSTHPDFIAPVFVFLIAGLLSWGARESAKVNNALTFVNLGTVSIIVFTGLFRLKPSNWAIRKEDIPSGVPNAGSGGFAPFGVAGIVTGAAKCFFGFVGFDSIATTGEETRNPKRNIPLAIILSLLVVFVCYFSIALVITMIIPYYEQNPDAPFPAIFDRLGWPLMKWVVTIGSLVALFTAMFGAFFPLPRILYAMSRDGLLYQLFCYVSPRTNTPIISTTVSGIITATMSAVFKLDQLIDMMSIGTLLAYIIVAVCVLLLRYSAEEDDTACAQDPVSVETLGNSYKDKMVSKDYNNIYIENTDDRQSLCNQTQQPNAENTTKYNSHTLHSDSQIKRSHYQENVNSEFSKLHSITAVDGFSKTVNDDEDFVSITKRETAKKRADAPQDEAVFSKDTGANALSSANVKNVFQTNLNTNSKLKQILQHLFNTENVPFVTRSSERVSKVCIYVLVALTILISFLLNSVTSVISVSEVEDMLRSNGSLHIADNRFLFNGTVEVASESIDQSLTGKSIPDVSDFSWESISKTSSEDPSNNEYSVHPLQTAQNANGPSHLSDQNSAQNNRHLGDEKPVQNSPNHPKKPTSLGSFLHDQLATSSAFLYLKESARRDVSEDKLRYCCYIIVGGAYMVTLAILARQAQNTRRLKFKVPFVPLVPCVSIFMNVYLMINLDVSTWVRLIVWLAIGMGVYFSYGISHSKQKKM